MNEIEIIKQAAKKITTNKKKEGYEPTGLYPYTDKDGHILYVRLRMDKPNDDKPIKLYWPLSRDDAGNWTQLKEPTFTEGKPLYNLPKINQSPDKTVFIVEGEKCADALTKLGLLATTSGGATSAKDANWQILKNREVVIWPDNDEAGNQYANDVKAMIKPLNVSVKEIDITPLNLPPKGDCVDFIAQRKELNGGDVTSVDIEALTLKNDLIQAPTSDLNQAAEPIPLSVNDADFIKQLASLKPIEYDRVRKEKAKLLGVQVKTLDSMVKDEREATEQENSPFKDIEPWHDAISPAQLLDEITNTIQRFIVLDKPQAQASALWVTACWFLNEINAAPILLINAPERACGKTQLLTVLAKLAPRTAQASGISPSVLFRMIEAYQPTLFIDEIETVLKDNEELRVLINAGHTRDSAYVWRSVAKGDDFEPKRFTVWGMKAIAGINAIKLAETVTSRSIVIELRRKRSDENVCRLRQSEPGLFENLSSKLARFSEDYSDKVKVSRPTLPDALGDRDQDNWEALLQVASVAGGHWLQTALNISLKISSTIQTPLSSANELLADIKEIFEAKKIIKITTSELITALCEDEEKSWATYNRGKPISPKQLSNKLKDYRISSKDLRFGYEGVKKGFEAEQFTEVFSRYLAREDTPENGHFAATTLQTNNGAGFNVADRNDIAATRNISATLKPSIGGACSGVADKTPIFEGDSAQLHDDVMEF